MPSDKKRLFSAFSQIRPHELQDGRGSGLGLVISKKIIEFHRGNLKVITEPGVGSNFYFVVLLEKAPQEEEEEEEGEKGKEGEEGEEAEKKTHSSVLGARSANIIRALVVDDVSSNRKLLARVLEKNNCECTLAADGAEAVKIYEERKGEGEFHLICMDAVMPIMGGLEATRQIRKLGFKGLLLGCTGNALEEDTAKFCLAGADEVMSKPLDIPTIRKKVVKLRQKLYNDKDEVDVVEKEVKVEVKGQGQ